MQARLLFGFLGAFSLAAACSGDGDGDGESSTTGPECPIGSAGCACTGGGACDPMLTCEGGVCRLPAGCDVGSQGCDCTTGGACNAGLLCDAGLCVPDPTGTTSNTSNTSQTSTNSGSDTDPTTTSTTGTTTTNSTGTSTTTTDSTTATETSGTTTGADCTPGEKGCACDAGSCDGGLMCAFQVCLAQASPSAHWPFEGNLNDASGNGFNGTAAGNIGYAAGVDGMAVTMDGFNYVEVSSFTNTFAGMQDSFTLGIRFNVNMYQGQQLQNLFSRGSSGTQMATNAFGLWLGGKDMDVLQFTETGNGAPNPTALAPQPPDKTWIDALFVLDGGVATYYENGEQKGEATYVAPQTQATQMWIGGYPALTFNFNGAIDDVQVFAGALTK